jgi:DNA-binding NarL/FixJ family response regulator
MTRCAGSAASPYECATNRSVAQQLHRSPHTVKTHVHNAFAKLGITSRTQLTELMRRSD